MAAYSMLLAEVDRVVDSPYPTQLKSLRDVLYTKCSVADINRCVQVRLCRIDDLAFCMLEGLRQWPYVLDIITRLACNATVRDALLQREPTLLSDLVEQALKTDHGRTKYSTAAVSMLSHPLPDDITLPSGVQGLFLRLVDRAVEIPSAATVTPVYSLLQGTSTLLLGLLSKETLSHFEEQLLDILFNSSRRSNHDGDQLLTLRCLAIMKLVATAADDQLMLTNSFYQTQELLASTQATSPRRNAAEMRKFFMGSGQVPKTITLLVLQSMWACQATGESLDERREALRLANDLMTVIPSELRDQWCASNTTVIQKLQHKALACEAEHSLQLQAFGLISQLCKPVFLQMSVVESIRQTISQPEALTRAGAQDQASWSHCMAAVLDLHTTEALLHKLLSYLVEANPSQIMESATVLVQLIRTLVVLADEHQEVTEAAMIVLSTDSFLQQLQGLTERAKSGAGPAVNGTTLCNVTWQNARRKACVEFSSLLLTSALNSHHTEHALAPHTASLLLELHTASARHDQRCRHTRLKHRQAQSCIAFVEHEGTPDDLPTNWRKALEAHLASEAQVNQSTLSRLFAQACQDLEARCEGVEQPLRDEQARRIELQEQYDSLNEAYATLEAQTIDGKLHYDSVEAERDQFLHDIDIAREESDGVMRRVSELERTLREGNQDAERRLGELQSAKDAADLQHATALAQKEEEVEDLEERAAATTKHLANKSDERDKLYAEVHDLRTTKDGLQADTTRLSGELDEKLAELDNLHSTARESAAYFTSLEAELQTARDDLAKDRKAHEQNLQQVQEHHKQIREAANASHNELMDHLAAQQGEEAANLERQLAVLRGESEKMAEQHAAELTKCEEEARDAEQQIDRLHRKCKQKDQQIAEANAMRSNLMAAMGIGQVQTQASLPHRTRTSSARTQLEPNSQLGPSPPTPASVDGTESEIIDGRASFASNASSGHSRNGPTPKRARPRKSFKAPSPAKPRLSMGTKAGRASAGGRSNPKRQPLLSVSVNRSPRKAAPRTPSKVAPRDAEDEYDDSTFDDNELLGHTPGGKMDVDLSGMLAEDTQE
ncbi:hypothetical protein LTR36_005598 [Oleoguttula mirabilis]|uniref:Uncharacterized protein n=1 Tax=Oleoguttula mirabilis TaxID=1507867 RepID=A0AAV9JEL4_9PEZI|nr:hypothetical protein LTR36_005598 [Oleoguttula mirabilis]